MNAKNLRIIAAIAVIIWFIKDPHGMADTINGIFDSLGVLWDELG